MKKSTLFNILFTAMLVICFQLSSGFAQSLQVSEAGVNSGNEVCLDITGNDLEGILGMQFSITFDNELLTFTDYTNLDPTLFTPANFGNLSDQGVITFSWVDPNLVGVSFTNDEILFSVCFMANSTVNSVTPVNIEGSPTAIEIIGQNDQIITPEITNGSVLISTMAGPLEILNTTIIEDYCGTSSGSIIIVTSGGTAPYTFSWQGPDGYSSTSEDIIDLQAGQYDLTIEDADGNTLTNSFTVSAANSLTITDAEITNVSCSTNDGSIDLTVAGNTPTFLWSNGATTEDITVSSGGDYAVTITDGDCSVTASYTVGETNILTSYAYDCIYFGDGNILTDISTVIWCGGTPPYIFEWSNGMIDTTENEGPGIVSTISIMNPSDQAYSVTITDNNGLTQVVDNIEIECTFPLQVSGEVTHTNCTNGTNGSIDITVTQGSQDYSFEWSNGATTEDLDNLESGSYDLTVTDNISGETATENFFVGGNLTLASSYQCQYPVSSTLTVVSWTGITPVTFEWNTGFTETVSGEGELAFSSLTTLLADALPVYTVTVTDATGCSETIEVINDCVDNSSDVYLSVSPEQSDIEYGESICLDIVANSFDDILSMQFSMEWDDALLHFEEVTNFNIPGLYASNFGQPEDDKLTFSWVNDPPSEGLDLPDNSVIFSLCFTALNSTGVAQVSITDNPTAIEIIDENLLFETLDITNAVVNIGAQQVTDGSIYVNSTTATQGDIICTGVNVLDLQGITGMQFSINWNPESLLFTGIENYFFEDETPIGISFSPFDEAAAEGNLLFLYLSNDVNNGVSFQEDTPLFEVCFEVLAESGVETVSISDNPIPIEFINNLNIPVNISATAGEIIILDALWPGDTDVNGIVNQYDLLNLGLAFGAEGTERIISTDWTAFYTPDWNLNTPFSGIDYKHMDTNGDGIINSIDTTALAQNWGLTNDNWDEEDFWEPQPTPENTIVLNTPFYVESDTIETEEIAMLDIVLGDLDNPATDVYGIAFTLTFEPEVVVPGSVHARFENSWLGTIDENMLAIYKEDYEAGKLHVAVTRTDGINVSGEGPIGALQITIKDVIFRGDLTEVAFAIEDVKMINFGEQQLIPESMASTTFIDATTDLYSPDLDKKIAIYPTPATDKVHITTNDVNIVEMGIFSANGLLIRKFNNDNEISVKDIPSGNYLLKIITDEGVVIKRISKI